jgi:hypothetical protein
VWLKKNPDRCVAADTETSIMPGVPVLPAGLKRTYKTQEEITDAEWIIAEQNGLDHCQKAKVWKPVSAFATGHRRKKCDHCVSRRHSH